MTHIEITGRAGSLGYPGWNDGAVPALLSDVSVASLSELLGPGRASGALLLPPGDFVPSLGLTEQVEPTETKQLSASGRAKKLQITLTSGLFHNH